MFSCFGFQANVTRTSLTLLVWRRRLNHKQQMLHTSIKVIYSCHHIMEQNSVPSCLRITAWHHRRVSSVVSTVANTDSVRLFAFTVFPSANTLTCRQSINFSFPPTPFVALHSTVFAPTSNIRSPNQRESIKIKFSNQFPIVIRHFS